MLGRFLKKMLHPAEPWEDIHRDIRFYPCQRSCIKSNMNQARPEQMPPLMVRKAAWRR